MKSLRQAALFLFGGLLLSVATPSCNADDADAEAGAAAGQAGSGGVVGGSAGRSSGRAGTESSSRGGGGTRGTTTDAGAAGDPQATSGASGNAAGQVGDGASAGEGGERMTNGGQGGSGGAAGTSGTMTGAGAAGEQAANGGTGNAAGQVGQGASAGNGGETTSGGHGGTAMMGSGGSGESPSCRAIVPFGDLVVETSHRPFITSFGAGVLPNLGSSARSDLISLRVLDSNGGDELGAFELGTGIDENLATCARCLTVSEDSSKLYFATAGTLTFDSDSLQMQGYPQGTLRDVTLREVTQDSSSHTTLVPGGSCLTLADADFLVNIAPPPVLPPEWTCDDDLFGDGWCDCGCGALDFDCASPASAECETCACGDNGGSCVDSAVNATQNYLCDASAPCNAITAFGDFTVYTGQAPASVSFSARALPNFGMMIPDTIHLDVGSVEVGTFELGTGVDDDFATCRRCLWVKQDMGVEYYLATEGTLTFDANSRHMEGYPQGTLRDVTLRQITFDLSSHSTVVPGGSCLTVADADLLVNVPGSPPPPREWVNCPASYYGDGECDCGCGALDSDCASSGVGDCQVCNCGDADCSLVNATENHLCDEVSFPPCTAITSLQDPIVNISYLPDLVQFGARLLPNLGSQLYDTLQLDAYSDEVGTFELGTGIDENVDTCARCLWAAEDNGSKIYLATAGTLTFDADSRHMEGYPQGTLRNVTLRQITYDSNYHSTVVPGGSCLTVANADVLVKDTPPPLPPAWDCPVENYGDGACDCGCGALDSDCTTSDNAACANCFCDGDNGFCSGSAVNATENHLCDASPPCTPISVDDPIIDTSEPGYLFVKGVVLPNLGDPEQDQIHFLVFSDEVGTFELGTGIDDDVLTCDRCLTVEQDVIANRRYYLATEGTLTLAADSLQIEGYPHGTLRNVTLRELTYRQGTVVPGGRCLTLADADLLVNGAPRLAPPGWNCVAGLYLNHSCECGCGGLDPSCASASAAECDACYCDRVNYSMSCSAVNATENYLCDGPPPPPPPPGWNCITQYYGDGDCDCGCGALDADCTSSDKAECEYCFCSGDAGSCSGSAVNATENHLCF